MKRIKTHTGKFEVKEGDKVYLMINDEKMVIHFGHNNEYIQLCIYVPKNEIEDDDIPF